MLEPGSLPSLGYTTHVTCYIKHERNISQKMNAALTRRKFISNSTLSYKYVYYNASRKGCEMVWCRGFSFQIMLLDFQSILP